MSFLNWPTVPDRPPDPTINLRFQGLLGFCYNSRGECEVGFNPGDGKHQITVLIDGRQIFPTGNLPDVIIMKFGIVGKANTVRFFARDPFDRQNGDAEDFRWMLDLEGDDFYAVRVDKDSDFQFRARLIVQQGVFYTQSLTQSTFDRVSCLVGAGSFNHQPLYRVISEIDAAVPLAPDETAFLEINGDRVFTSQPGRKYEVRFGNGCEEPAGKICEWSPGSLLESHRSDFHFHRGLFDLGLFQARYGLKLKHAGPDVTDKSDWHIFGSDLAPCMGVGFGQTDGFGGQ